MKKLVAVFGPANCKGAERLYDDAARLGTLLAQAGFTVVTGGYEGIMEAVSKGARAAGGAAIGITAEVYYAKGREANEYLTREIRVKSATDRLMELLDLPDAWCAIGNSTGTLAEVAMAWDYMTKGFIEKKPIILIGESWKGFLEYVQSERQFGPWLDLIEMYEEPELAVGSLLRKLGAQAKLPIPDLPIISREDSE